MNKYFIIIYFFVSITISVTLNSCQGCSNSGRESIARSNNSRDSRQKPTPNQTIRENQKSRNISENISLSTLFQQYKSAVFIIYTSDSQNTYQGTGFFVSSNGIAISNYHVFEGTSQGLETIETIDGEQFTIKEVLEKSKEKDYIIFRVNIGNCNVTNPIPLVSQTPQIGEDVFAIGNPRGLESTLSKGIVSAFRENNTLIQTTAEITHGSSGGPLLNMKGEVIGITTAGLGEANLNFAVNIKSLKLYRFLK